MGGCITVVMDEKAKLEESAKQSIKNVAKVAEKEVGNAKANIESKVADVQKAKQNLIEKTPMKKIDQAGIKAATAIKTSQNAINNSNLIKTEAKGIAKNAILTGERMVNNAVEEMMSGALKEAQNFVNSAVKGGSSAQKSAIVKSAVKENVPKSAAKAQKSESKVKEQKEEEEEEAEQEEAQQQEEEHDENEACENEEEPEQEAEVEADVGGDDD